MDGALRQREWQLQKFPGEASRALRSCGSPEWLVSEKPRRALLAAAQAVIRHAALSLSVEHIIAMSWRLPLCRLLQDCETLKRQ